MSDLPPGGFVSVRDSRRGHQPIAGLRLDVLVKMFGVAVFGNFTSA